MLINKKILINKTTKNQKITSVNITRNFQASTKTAPPLLNKTPPTSTKIPSTTTLPSTKATPLTSVIATRRTSKLFGSTLCWPWPWESSHPSLASSSFFTGSKAVAGTHFPGQRSTIGRIISSMECICDDRVMLMK